MVRYNFYATLFDAFTWFKSSESDNAFDEFIDKINRKPFSSEAADKGTAFNQLVDLITSEETYIVELEKDKRDIIQFPFDNKEGVHYEFEFPKKVLLEFVKYFEGSIKQLYCESLIDTKYGNVNLYGYIDELKIDTCYDIKTTSNYTFPKYLNGFQHLIYPYCLNKAGIFVNKFEYTITDFKNVYKEPYNYIPNLDDIKIKVACEELIEFIEEHKELITDKKIFNDIS